MSTNDEDDRHIRVMKEVLAKTFPRIEITPPANPCPTQLDRIEVLLLELLTEIRAKAPMGFASSKQSTPLVHISQLEGFPPIAGQMLPAQPESTEEARRRFLEPRCTSGRQPDSRGSTP